MPTTARPVVCVAIPTLSRYRRFVIGETIRATRLLFAVVPVSLFLFALSPILPFAYDVEGIARYRANLNLLYWPVVFPTALLTIAYVSAGRRWRQAAELRDAVTYSIDEQGFTIVSEHSNAVVGWERIKTVRTHRDFLALGLGQPQFYLLPFSGFESPSDVETLMAILRRRGMIR